MIIPYLIMRKTSSDFLKVFPLISFTQLIFDCFYFYWNVKQNCQSGEILENKLTISLPNPYKILKHSEMNVKKAPK